MRVEINSMTRFQNVQESPKEREHFQRAEKKCPKRVIIFLKKLGNRHTLCRRFGKGLACVGPSSRQNLPTIKVYQPTAGMNRVTIV